MGGKKSPAEDLPFVDGTFPLYRAAHNADVRGVKRILKEFKSKKDRWTAVNSRNEDAGDNSVLHIAASRGYLLMAKDLLDAGAELLPDERNRTPLHLAAINDDKDMVALLLKRCKDPHGAKTVFCDGYSRPAAPIHLCKKPEIRKLLFYRGCTVRRCSTRAKMRVFVCPADACAYAAFGPRASLLTRPRPRAVLPFTRSGSVGRSLRRGRGRRQDETGARRRRAGPRGDEALAHPDRRVDACDRAVHQSAEADSGGKDRAAHVQEVPLARDVAAGGGGGVECSAGHDGWSPCVVCVVAKVGFYT